MDIENIKCFVSLAECLNFTKAAEKEHITQTTMSRIIHSLENEMDIPLFYRDSRVVRLTEAGREFYTRAIGFISLYDQTLISVRNAHNGFNRELRIGVGPYEDKLLASALKNYTQANQNVKISCIQLSYQRLIKQFEQDLLDVIITSDQYLKELDHFPVRKYLVHDEDFMLGLHRENPLNEYEMIPSKRLSDQTLITMNSGPIFSVRDIYHSVCEFQKLIYVNTYEAKLLMIRANLGIGFFPSFVSYDLPADTCLKPLDVPSRLRKFYILCKKDRRTFVHDFLDVFISGYQPLG